MTTKSGGTEKPPGKTRNKDNRIKTSPAKQAAAIFVEAITTDASRGAVTRAGQKAYPNQKRRSAAQTGHKLLKHPYIQEQIAKRRERALRDSDITRQEVIGLLAQQTRASLADMLNAAGTDLDMKRAREMGVDHLIKEVVVTERHHTKRIKVGVDEDGKAKYRTETHKRVTTKYKLHDPQKAMDLLSEIAGWKREPAKNPVDTAKATFNAMRRDVKYADMSDAELALYPAAHFKVSVDEILQGQEQ